MASLSSSNMQFNSIFASLALATLSCAASVPQPKVLSLPFTKTRGPDSSIKSKRDGNTHSQVLNNERYYYQATLKVGTPAVEVNVNIDTGSPDLWVGPKFQNSQSSTWQGNGHSYSISYLDGTSALGELGTDVLELAGATVNHAEFASVNKNIDNARDGVFGVGYYAEDEQSDGYIHKNVPAVLKDQGLIDTVAYSLWLNNFESQKDGSILFGGVDHARYEGTLSKVPIIFAPEAYNGQELIPNTRLRLATILNGISLKNSGGDKVDIVSGAALPVILDSGSTYNLLPQDFVKAIGESLPGALLQQGNPYGFYIVTDVPDGSVVFNFSGVEIEIPFSEFIVDGLDADGKPVILDGKPVKVIGAQYNSNLNTIDYSQFTTYLLGDTFLSGAYVAYDLDNNEIGLARAKVGDDVQGSDVEAIGSNGIPGTQAPNYSSTEYRTDYTTATANIF